MEVTKKSLRDEGPAIRSMCKNWRVGSTSIGEAACTDPLLFAARGVTGTLKK